MRGAWGSKKMVPMSLRPAPQLSAGGTWFGGLTMGAPPNKITGANAGGAHQPPVRKSWAARIAQCFR